MSETQVPPASPRRRVSGWLLFGLVLLAIFLLPMLWVVGGSLLQTLSALAPYHLPQDGTLYGPFESPVHYYDKAFVGYDAAGNHSVAVVAVGSEQEFWLCDGKPIGPVTTGPDNRDNFNRVRGGLDAEGKLWATSLDYYYDGHYWKAASLRPEGGTSSLNYTFGEVPCRFGGLACGAAMLTQQTPTGPAAMERYYYLAFGDKLLGPGAYGCKAVVTGKPGVPWFGYKVPGTTEYRLARGAEKPDSFARLWGPYANLNGATRITFMYSNSQDGPVWLWDNGNQAGPYLAGGEVLLSPDGKRLALNLKDAKGAVLMAEGKELVRGQQIDAFFAPPGNQLIAFVMGNSCDDRQIWIDGKPTSLSTPNLSFDTGFVQRSTTGKTVAFHCIDAKDRRTWVWVNGKLLGPYGKIADLAFGPGPDDYSFWASDLAGSFTSFLPNGGGSEQDWQQSYLVVQGKKLEGYTLASGYRHIPGPVLPSGTHVAPERVVEKAGEQYVWAGGEFIGPFPRVVSVRRDNPQGPLTIFYSSNSLVHRLLSEQFQQQRPGAVWVNGERLSLRQYSHLARTKAGPTYLCNRLDWPVNSNLPAPEVWVAGKRYGPFDKLLAYAVSPKANEFTLAFIKDGKSYLWQGPIPPD